MNEKGVLTKSHPEEDTLKSVVEVNTFNFYLVDLENGEYAYGFEYEIVKDGIQVECDAADYTTELLGDPLMFYDFFKSESILIALEKTFS